MKAKVGDTIRVIWMDDIRGYDYEGRTGTVEYIDSLGQLHGTWGGLALIPGVDEYDIIRLC